MKSSCPVYPKPLKDKASLLYTFFKKRNSWLDGIYERSYRMKMGHIKLPGLEIFMLNQPELVKQVMVDDPEHFPKHDLLGDILEPLLGESIFTTNGAQWRKQRDMLDVSFDNARVEQVFDRMQDAAARMLSRLGAYADGAVVDVDPEMTLVTADIIFRTIMSSSLDAAEAQAVLEAFVRFQKASPKLAMLNMFGVPDNWLLRLSDHKRRDDAKLIRRSLEKVIRPRYDAFRRGEIDASDDILSSILRAKDPDSHQGFSFDEIVDQVAMLFLAGHETSASALTWTLYLLAISPDIQQAVAEEVALILGDDKGAVPLAAVKKMSLLRRVFMESMRLYPPVGFLARQVTKSVSMRDKQVAKGALLVISPWLLHRHRELWDVPDEFCPERFDPKSEGRGVPKNGYLPFGMGARVCIGATFAMQEAILILAELLRRYRFELAPGFQPDPVGRLTIRSENGMKLVMSRR